MIKLVREWMQKHARRSATASPLQVQPCTPSARAGERPVKTLQVPVMAEDFILFLESKVVSEFAQSTRKFCDEIARSESAVDRWRRMKEGAEVQFEERLVEFQQLVAECLVGDEPAHRRALSGLTDLDRVRMAHPKASGIQGTMKASSTAAGVASIRQCIALAEAMTPDAGERMTHLHNLLAQQLRHFDRRQTKRLVEALEGRGVVGVAIVSVSLTMPEGPRALPMWNVTVPERAVP